MTVGQCVDINGNMTLQERLRKAARESGMSIKAMSDRAKIPYFGVHRFVRDDTTTMTLKTASRLAELLDLELKPRKRRGKAKG